jgi:hypothetical protein
MRYGAINLPDQLYGYSKFANLYFPWRLLPDPIHLLCPPHLHPHLHCLHQYFGLTPRLLPDLNHLQIIIYFNYPHLRLLAGHIQI